MQDANIVTWKNENVVLAVDASGIHTFDIRKLGARQRLGISGILDFRATEHADFFVVREKKKYYLAKMTEKIVKKECVGGKIEIVRDGDFCIAVLGQDCLEFFTQKRTWRVSLGEIGAVRMLQFGRESGDFYVFAGSGIYRLQYTMPV